ncbi:hypothetical protein K458DRAFT_301646 [Lentithecium fluviatile CBS 122367]|uniref:Uncharacterized protein n=1 Tax=Lentithecium fluviatile CBS 122367 TaxID=1168545 RepID=A0A6G1J3L8_9PLEO|nr:hypothetical protein K458DRAFT_301646 [Lentithecium fluviatile CBS 122367]
MSTIAKAIANKEDLLRIFPTEIRLMIFKELMTVDKDIYRGARSFGPLDSNEYDLVEGGAEVPWQILFTCQQYHDEAIPYMYSENTLIFCTGPAGSPGMFRKFPVKRKYMKYLRDVGIYFRADAPAGKGSQRVGHFINALTLRAKNLNELFVMAASDRYFERVCPWDIVDGGHPVAKALENMVLARAVKFLTIRVHDGAKFYKDWGYYMAQTFWENGGQDEDRNIAFQRSCSCPPLIYPECPVCLMPTLLRAVKPVVFWVGPDGIEANEEETMNMQADLFELGILPGYDDDDEEKGLEQGLKQDYTPIEDEEEEARKAFSSTIFAPEQKLKYRGVIKAPQVWKFRQTGIKEYMKPVEDDAYL